MMIGDIQAELARLELTTGQNVRTYTHLHIHPDSLAQVLESCDLHHVLEPSMIHLLLGFIIEDDYGLAPGHIRLSRGLQDRYYHHAPPSMVPLQTVLNSTSAAMHISKQEPAGPVPIRAIDLDAL